MNLQTPGSLIGPPMVLGQYGLHDKDTAIYYTLEIYGVWGREAVYLGHLN